MNADGQTPIAYYQAGGTSSVGPASRSAWWRQPTAVALIIVSCLSAPAALTSAYVHRVIMNVDGYVNAVAPVAGDHAVQMAVADALAKQVSGALDAEQALPDGLPPELGAITGSLSAQLGDLTRQLTMDVVSSREFHDFWVEANRRVHPVLIRAIESKGKVRVSASDLVGVDLSAVTGNITDLLKGSGVSLPDVLPEGLTSGDVVLLDSRPLATAGAAILALDKLYPVLPLLTAMLLLGAVLVATRRSLATLYAGAGLTAAMLAVEAGLAVGRARYLGATDDAGIPHAASAAIWGAVTSSLRLWGWAVLVIGLALAAAGTLAYFAAGRRGGRQAVSQPARQESPSYADYLYLPGHDPERLT
jgi:hypothetical protein